MTKPKNNLMDRSMNFIARTGIALSLIAVTTATVAQNANVVNAYNYMKDADYAKAVEYIEPASEHEATSLKDKTWRYRGDIYRLIAMGEDAALKEQFPDAMEKAIDSYLKAVELDTKGSYKNDNVNALGALQGAALNTGNDAFTTKDYDKAILLYGYSEKIAKAFGQVDTNAVFNSALAYETKGDNANAMKRYQESIDLGYDKAEVYRYLASLQHKTGDADAAIATVRVGQGKFPSDKDLILDEMSYLLTANRFEEAEKSVQAGIKQDPNNAVLYSVLGSLYDQKANPKEGEAPVEEVMLTNYDLAEEAYKKSIDLDPKFFDAYFNIGVLYNNRAAFEYEKIKDIKDNSVYTEKKKVADAIYLKAIPYFEKAHELQPDDVQTAQQLMKLYAKTGDQEKYKEMKAKIGG